MSETVLFRVTEGIVASSSDPVEQFAIKSNRRILEVVALWTRSCISQNRIKYAAVTTTNLYEQNNIGLLFAYKSGMWGYKTLWDPG